LPWNFRHVVYIDTNLFQKLMTSQEIV
jgi:hypothetical protein